MEVWSLGLAADILRSSLGRSAQVPQRPEVMSRRHADLALLERCRLLHGESMTVIRDEAKGQQA